MEDNNIQFVVDENGYKHYLEKEIGRGGQGITWQTKDPNIIVKMKVNPSTGEPIIDEAEYEKFKNELDEVRILNLPEDIHIARPVSLLQKPYCGYTMRLLKDMRSRCEDHFNKKSIFKTETLDLNLDKKTRERLSTLGYIN